MYLSTWNHSKPLDKLGNGLVSFNTTTFQGTSKRPLKGPVSSFVVRKIEDNFEMSNDVSYVLQQDPDCTATKNQCGIPFWQSSFSAKDIAAIDPPSIGHDDPAQNTSKYQQDVTFGDMTYEQYKKSKKIFGKAVDKPFQFWDFQPLYMRLPNEEYDIAFYMPFGGFMNAFVVVVNGNEIVKTLHVDLTIPKYGYLEYTNNWTLYVDAEAMPDFVPTSEIVLTELPIVLMNVVKKDAKLLFYRRAFVLNWPRVFISACSVCQADSGSSQLCGPGYCQVEHDCLMVGSGEEETARVVEIKRKGNEIKNSERMQFHITEEGGDDVCIQCFELCNDPTWWRLRDVVEDSQPLSINFCLLGGKTIILRVDHVIFEILMNWEYKIEDVFQTKVTDHRDNIVCYSPFLSPEGYFHLITAAGDLVAYGPPIEGIRAVHQNIIPKTALLKGTVKLFFLRKKELVLYYFAKGKHYYMNIDASRVDK